MLVQEAMTPDPVICNVKDTVSSVGVLMRTKRIGGLPVMDGERLAGMITETDLLKLLMTKGPSDDLWLPSPFEIIELPIREFINWERTKEALTDIGSRYVSSVMSTPVITITPDEDIEAAASLMLQKKVDRLAVVDNGKLTGIITREDIVWAISGKKEADA
ncbi:MAG: histidine kinase [Methanomicrobiales archaeon HGW-Methanomicrobiales-4]|nr:MAG: histidine kinase [Methanomicrobiales archaeon HGW-Methanomicrobiales-4]